MSSISERYFNLPINKDHTVKKALLMIDRGSREPEVRQELAKICSLTKRRAGYDYVDYCFLEVLPPFIEEGLNRCIDFGVGFITVMPYFLYPGMKLKDTVKQCAKLGRDKNLKIAITKPLSYHPTLAQIIVDRIDELMRNKDISYSDSECDVVLVGHGSSDKNARDAFIHAANSIRSHYRNVHICFLELDQPNIEVGINQAVATNPKVILIMPYFLHKGAHIKIDVIKDLNAALASCKFKNAFISRHLGVDEKLIDLVIERAKEVEMRYGI